MMGLRFKKVARRISIVICVMAGVMGCSQKSMEADFDSPEQAMAQARHYFWGTDGFPLNETKALKIFEQYPDNEWARYYIALAYEHGRGGYLKNDEKAVAIYQQLYAVGSKKIAALAGARLAWYYVAGVVVMPDTARAIRLYQNAAENYHDAYANYQLGYLYLNAIGVAYDPNKAYGFFREAAALHHDGYALSALGEMYLRGAGVAQNLLTAEVYFRRAIARGRAARDGDKSGYLSLAYLYMYQKQVSEIETLLQEIPKENNINYQMARFVLCDFLRRDRCAEKIMSQIIAENPDYQNSAYWLPYLLRKNNDLSERKHMVSQLRDASEAEQEFALGLLSWVYQNGVYVDKDLAVATAYKHTLHEKMHLTAAEFERHYTIGTAYFIGITN